jgi:hypothetical protein
MVFTLKLGFQRENTYLVRFELPSLGEAGGFMVQVSTTNLIAACAVFPWARGLFDW